jgi:hypothetical protein
MQRIINSRLTGDKTSDEDNVRKEGFKDLNEYFRVQLSQPMEATEFVQFLFAHQLHNRTKQGFLKPNIENAIILAVRANEPWIIRNPEEAPGAIDLGNLMVKPREAAQWLLAPMTEDLVPPGLRAFLEANKELGHQPIQATPATRAAWRPPSRVGEARLREWMSKLLATTSDPNQRTVEKAARTEFGNKVTRDMVRKVLRELKPDLCRPGPRAPRKSLNTN